MPPPRHPRPLLFLARRASPAFATAEHRYGKNEYAIIQGGRAPNGKLSVAAHGGGESRQRRLSHLPDGRARPSQADDARRCQRRQHSRHRAGAFHAAWSANRAPSRSRSAASANRHAEFYAIDGGPRGCVDRAGSVPRRDRPQRRSSRRRRHAHIRARADMACRRAASTSPSIACSCSTTPRSPKSSARSARPAKRDGGGNYDPVLGRSRRRAVARRPHPHGQARAGDLRGAR